jgi:hypothetical protein
MSDALSNSYVENLENRIEKLQALLHRVGLDSTSERTISEPLSCLHLFMFDPHQRS